MLPDEPEPAPLEERVPIRGLVVVGVGIGVLLVAILLYHWISAGAVRPAEAPQAAAPAPAHDAPNAPPPESSPAAPPLPAEVPSPAVPSPALPSPAQEPASALKPAVSAPVTPPPVAPAPKPPQTQTPAPTLRNGYAVQVGAFESEDRANVLVHTMALHHQDGHVVKIQGTVHILYAVRTAVYRTRKDAAAEAKRLADQENLPTYVVRIHHGD